MKAHDIWKINLFKKEIKWIYMHNFWNYYKKNSKLFNFFTVPIENLPCQPHPNYWNSILFHNFASFQKRRKFSRKARMLNTAVAQKLPIIMYVLCQTITEKSLSVLFVVFSTILSISHIFHLALSLNLLVSSFLIDCCVHTLIFHVMKVLYWLLLNIISCIYMRFYKPYILIMYRKWAHCRNIQVIEIMESQMWEDRWRMRDFELKKKLIIKFWRNHYDVYA